MGIDSCDYEGWEAPQYALCKLETQKNWWCHWVSFCRPNNQELQCSRTGEEGCSIFLFYLGPNGIEDAHPYWWGWIFFTQATDINAAVFQKHPQVCTQKSCFTSYMNICSAATLTHKINHQRWVNYFFDIFS